MRKIIDLTGKRFGYLSVIEWSHKNSRFQSSWKCICECGKEKIIMGHALTSGGTVSCGCHRESMHIKHGQTLNGNLTKTYNSWRSMIRRCNDKKHIGYKDYGGKGITVCNDWLDFKKFNEDMGERTKNKTLDRIDVNGNYCKENCKWSTDKEQANNRGNNIRICFNGERLTITEWAIKIGVSRFTLFSRINELNWSIERSLTTPTRKKSISN